jgi:hypothetical protein
MMAGGAFLLTILLCWLFAPGFRTATGTLVAPPRTAGPDPDLLASLGAERDSLRSKYWGNLAACVPEKDTLEEAPPELPLPEGRDLAAPETDEAPVPLEAAAPPPPPEPEPEPEKPDPEPKPKARAKPRADAKPAADKPKSRPTQKPGEQLIIPPGAKDLGFLQGCWKSDAGLADTVYGQPVLTYLCFPDGGGRATHRTDMLGPGGRARATCPSSGKASLSGGKLVIRVQMARCKGWNGAFSPATITCTARSAGAAQCVFHSDGGSPARARITRQGGRG